MRRGVDTYDPSGYRKHKSPDGWGSLCPHDLTLEEAQSLFATGVRVGDKVFNVSEHHAFQAQEHLPEIWHGHPIPWSRLPAAAVKSLESAGRLTMVRFRKAIRKNLGAEFSK